MWSVAADAESVKRGQKVSSACGGQDWSGRALLMQVEIEHLKGLSWRLVVRRLARSNTEATEGTKTKTKKMRMRMGLTTNCIN